MLHLAIWEASPGQGRPRFSGAGLLQRRVRVCSPPPQDAEHWLHACHCPQFPSTEERKKEERGFSFQNVSGCVSGAVVSFHLDGSDVTEKRNS